jgi:monoamine oxidase
MSGSAQYREFQPDHAVIYSASFVLPSLSLSDVGTQLHYLSHFGVPTEGFTAQPAFQASYEIDRKPRLPQKKRPRRKRKRCGDAFGQAATATGYVTLLAFDNRRDVLQATLTTWRETLRIFGGHLQGPLDAVTAKREKASLTYRRAILVAFRDVDGQMAVIADPLRHATDRYRAGRFSLSRAG